MAMCSLQQDVLLYFIHYQIKFKKIFTSRKDEDKGTDFNILFNGLLCRYLFGLCIGISIALGATTASAEVRHPDPEGCFSCHGIENLNYIDQEGVLRSASINRKHYYSALHGNVPCRDCHRDISEFPHEAKNGEVDCADSCHVEEPSKGEAYNHRYVVEEYQSSVHGEGWSSGFTGGNRFEEEAFQSNPSCRQCHSNELYISAESLPKFKDSFDHMEAECGTCHQGEVWLGQFGGHILRRLIGSRWNKRVHNEMCNRCHNDHERMAKLEIEKNQGEPKEKVSARFVLASESYASTLHGRILDSDVNGGASCLDCHAPKNFRHGVLRDEHKLSSTHRGNIAETCSQSGCHGFASHPLNARFVETDVHDLDQVSSGIGFFPNDSSRLESGWVKILAVLLPVLFFLAAGTGWSHFFGEKKKGIIFSRFGGVAFQEKILGRKPKGKNKPKPKPKPKPEPEPEPEPEPIPSDTQSSGLDQSRSETDEN